MVTTRNDNNQTKTLKSILKSTSLTNPKHGIDESNNLKNIEMNTKLTDREKIAYEENVDSYL
jgi:hypothetical protein